MGTKHMKIACKLFFILLFNHILVFADAGVLKLYFSQAVERQFSD